MHVCPEQETTTLDFIFEDLHLLTLNEAYHSPHMGRAN